MKTIPIVTEPPPDKLATQIDDLKLDGPEKPARKKSPAKSEYNSDTEDTFTAFYQDLRATTTEYSNRVDGEYVVLIQVGSFYELYFEQAERYAGLLGITLTKKKLKSVNVSFAGFPDYKLDKYLQLIFNAGLKAVVCEQRKGLADNEIVRPVDRLVTPGTIIDDGIRDYHRNNHLLAITFPENPFKNQLLDGKIGLAWCDVTLGTFHVLDTTFTDLMAAITRINPSEIVIDSSFDLDYLISGRWMPQYADLRNEYVTRFTVPSTTKQIEDHTGRFAENRQLVLAMLDNLTIKERSASKLLLSYLDQCIPNYNTRFELPSRSLPSQVMHIDPRAAQDLELIETMRGGLRVGALANIIDRTVTNPGARLLNSWLLMPSTNVKEIRRRHQIVSLMLKNDEFTTDMRILLRKTSDVNRIVRRIDNGRADLTEYLELATTISLLQEIYKLSKENPDSLKFTEPIFGPFLEAKKVHKLSKRIQHTIDPKCTTRDRSMNGLKMETEIVRDGWNILKDASPRLVKLREKYDEYLQEFESLSSSIQSQLAELGYNGSIKFILSLRDGEFLVDLRTSSKGISSIVSDAGLKIKHRNKSALKLSVPEWEKLGAKLIHLEKEITTEESVIMKDLENEIFDIANDLMTISPIIELLDTTQSFANMASEKDLVCPVVDQSTTFDIVEGKHLVVEEGLRGRSMGVENFTSNSCQLQSGHAWIITGPNMGGKSTFLRQNAIIAILAQIGSFVPAKKAHIGIIDKIFTRVGSSDNIFKNQSTFMVEMNETAIILREATERSLVIVDELGRGTSTGEGVAIAYASLMTMINKNGSKVLFATHFGPELWDLIRDSPEFDGKVDFYRTELKKINQGNLPIDEKIIFNHKLQRGLSRHSHALEIAELAGFPQSTLEIAKKRYTGDD